MDKFLFCHIIGSDHDHGLLLLHLKSYQLLPSWPRLLISVFDWTTLFILSCKDFYSGLSSCLLISIRSSLNHPVHLSQFVPVHALLHQFREYQGREGSTKNPDVPGKGHGHARMSRDKSWRYTEDWDMANVQHFTGLGDVSV